MKRKFIKLLLSGSAVAFGTLTMSSCASTATNLFGIYANVDSNYDDNTTVTIVQEGEDGKDGEEKIIPAGYKGIFKGFKFNNFGFSSGSSLISTINQDEDPLSYSYSSHSWNDFMFPLLNYTISLSDLYNMDFSGGDITSLKNHPIIKSDNDNLLEQFVYSWANVLSKGKETIRFGVTAIKTKVTNPSESFFPQVSSTSSSNDTTDTTEQDSNASKLVWTWDDDKQESGKYTYTSTNNFQIGFQFGYWNAANDNVNQGQSSKEDLINMIKKTGSWSSEKDFNVENIKENMWLVLNFNFSLTLSYSEEKVIEKKNQNDTSQNESKNQNNTDQENNHQDILWTEYLKNERLIPIFSFNDENKKININSTSESVQVVSDLIKSDSYDAEKVNNIKDKYLNQITLYENWN
ncbi:MAG: hypothetical protein K2G54_02865 [Malacoplasma sp.]|nr:hypothetical protein [Malacoplasma sp.]